MDMQSAASAFAAAAATFSAVVAIGTFLPAWCTLEAEAELEKKPIRAYQSCGSEVALKTDTRLLNLDLVLPR